MNNAATSIFTRTQTEIIQDLINCAMACEACSNSCLHEAEKRSLTRCISLSRDCAEICFQAARLVTRNSELAHQYLTICEEACRLCADECRKHKNEACMICSEACENCGNSCNRFYSDLKN